ncbi:MAG: zinc carboxypeptidase [Sphingobacteriia bacterium]|nr:MAG: zinc carboxypeptidase [Sphingobacteriia bacterium]
MRSLLLAVLTSLMAFSAPAQDLSYYLPKNVSFNPAIPTPASVIGHEVGEWHITHDRLVQYMKALDAASDRISLQVMGTTPETRPQIALLITSTQNQARLEQIRQEHLLLSDPKRSADANLANMPTVVWMGHSIHGNEPSGANAGLLTAYYLAAAQGPAIEALLNQVVVVFDPSFNPDGLQRFATWVNSNRGQTLVSDPASRELNEAWPAGRFNHYLFDLNRDWLPAQHRESQNRLNLFHAWKPNILTDHHEQGSNASFFFQPGVPSRVNPNTPARNQELTAAIGNYHAKAFDSIGSLYFTKEGYDDFYYGKGSTYPDINGAVGILFEQASSRGHLQETDNGLLAFPFTIRNQFNAALSTLAAAQGLRKELLTFQRDFYKDVVKEGAAFPVKGYVIGDEADQGRTQVFVQMMLRHQVQVYPLSKDLSTDGKNFKAGKAFYIPTAQPQFKIIKTAFEKTFEYKDSLFYDVTSWTLALAFGLPHAEIKAAAPETGAALSTLKPLGLNTHHLNNTYAYAFRWSEFLAPKLLYTLQSKGLMAKVATQKFKMMVNGKEEAFDYGTIIIPVGLQTRKGEVLANLIDDCVGNSGVEVFALPSGMASGGIDLGSGSFLPVKTPRIMMFSGAGTTPTDVGEIWHLLDTRMQIPVTLVDVDRFNAINPARYTTIIMASGAYNNLDKNAQEKLRTWVSAGGTLVATEDAVKYLADNGFTKVSFRPTAEKRDSSISLPWNLRSDESRAKDMAGSLFEARLDMTHPLGYGYTQPMVTVFKSNTLFMNKSASLYGTPVQYTENPLQSGYLYRGYKNAVKSAAAVNVDNLGRGRVISQVDNLNFRAFWLGTAKLFMNALYFGDLIR